MTLHGSCPRLVLAAIVATLGLAAPSQASDGTWNLAWGKDVDSSLAGTGFEICAVAANCQQGSNTTALGGEVNGPFGVATDATGNVYVADTNNNRVQKFDALGNFVSAWGKDVDSSLAGTGFEICTVAANCQIGSIATAQGGELNFPEGVATDAAGDVYVSDSSNHRIQKFDSDGNFLRAWGKGVNGGAGFQVCTVASSCQAGSNTTALGGELNLPHGIATDGGGNVYVADKDNERVQKFDSAGAFEAAWGADVDSALVGTGFEICTVAANCKAGTVNHAGGEFQDPRGVATDPNDSSVYVADSGNHRMQKFAAAGTFDRTWGTDVDSTQPGVGFEICTATSGDTCKEGSLFGSLGGEVASPTGVATDAAGNVYVADSGNYRIQRFDATGSFGRAWGKDVDSVQPGTGFEICTAAANCQSGATSGLGGLGGEFNTLTGIASDAAGVVYVDDYGNQRIQKFTEAAAAGGGVPGGGSSTTAPAPDSSGSPAPQAPQAPPPNPLPPVDLDAAVLGDLSATLRGKVSRRFRTVTWTEHLPAGTLTDGLRIRLFGLGQAHAKLTSDGTVRMTVRIGRRGRRQLRRHLHRKLFVRTFFVSAATGKHFQARRELKVRGRG